MPEHAINIARRWGIYYVWIDSLCIIQDSEDGWARESTRMGWIYANSYCNIAAIGFADRSNGLFVSRDPSLLKPLEVDLEGNISEDPYDHHWGAVKGRYTLVDFNTWRTAWMKSP